MKLTIKETECVNSALACYHDYLKAHAPIGLFDTLNKEVELLMCKIAEL